MSERMTPIPFKQLMTWIKEEHDNEKATESDGKG